MSWGYRITILTAGFVCFMLFLVISAFHQTFDLVTEDYYGQELKFEDQIEKQRNQQQMNQQMSCNVSENMLVIRFPEKLSGIHITGNILFFRPSDAKKDFIRPVAISENGIQRVPLALFSKGLYRARIDYQAGGNTYYFEQSIMIP